MPPKSKAKANAAAAEVPVVQEPVDANALDYASRTRVFKVIITAIADAEKPSLKNPSFRYTYWGQRREATPELGDAKGGWKEVDLGGGRKAWQWEKAYEPVNIDREWAVSLNRNPLLLFTLSDKAEGELATSVPPRLTATAAVAATAAAIAPTAPPPGGKGVRKSLTSQSVAPQGRNFLHSVILDASVFLSADRVGSVSQTQDKTTSTTEDDPSSLPPPGLSFLRIELASDKPDAAVLSTGLLHDLNPLTIRIRDLKNLPGLMLDTLPQQKYLEPDKYHLLNKLCRPVYAAVWPFYDSELFPRLVRTPGVRNQPQIKWDQKVVYLTGHLDRHRLEDKVQNGVLYVQIHDRDPLPSSSVADGGVKDRVRRWERMVAGGYTLDIKTNTFVEEEAASGMDPDQLRVVPAMSVYEVDDLVLKEWEEDVSSARDKCLHGVAAIPMAQLLDQSRQLSSAFARNQIKDPFAPPACDERPRFKGRYDVIAQKSRRKPKGGAEMEEWDLTAEERLVRHEVGKYLESGCTLGVEVGLQRPLRTLQEGDAERTGPATEPLPLYGRAAIMFEYENSRLLKDIMAAIDQVNRACLPNIVGSLRSYELSEEEVAATNRGEMDVVCGFQLIDDDCRTIVIEGKGDSGLAKVMANLPRLKRNDEGYRVLYHPRVRFTDRLYTRFNVDLKKIRLRYPLPTLCMMPELFDRAKIPVEFFEALHRLNLLRQVGRLSHAQVYSLFPPPEMLIKIESRYGETITKLDISGDVPRRRSLCKRRSTARGAIFSSVNNINQGNNRLGSNNQELVASPLGGSRSAHASDRRKGSTHCINLEFLEQLKHRKVVDFLALRQMESEQARAAYEAYRNKRLQEEARDPVPASFQYGTQKLQYVELKKAALRRALSRRGDAVFTYSNDYMSLNFPLVDEFRIAQEAAAKSKAKWLTKKGFVWPVPRAPSELRRHPQRPSSQRIEDLKEPWMENQLHPKAVSRSNGEGVLFEGQPEFYNYPTAAGRVFGGYERPEFDRDYDSSKVGDPSRLPRGRMVLRPNASFYRSVHLGGVESVRQQKEASEKEKADAQGRVVVDSEFKVTKMLVKDRPLQLDRAVDILADPPQTKALKKVRNAHLPSGKLVKMEPPPITIATAEPYADMTDFASTFRAKDTSLFVVRDPETDEPVEFVSAVHRDAGKPKSQTVMCRRKHPVMTWEEKAGPKWER